MDQTERDYVFTAYLASGTSFRFELTLERGEDGDHGLLDAALSFLRDEVCPGAAEVYDLDHRAWALTPDTKIVAMSLDPKSS